MGCACVRGRRGRKGGRGGRRGSREGFFNLFSKPIVFTSWNAITGGHLIVIIRVELILDFVSAVSISESGKEDIFLFYSILFY